jgi:hypothetical protein
VVTPDEFAPTTQLEPAQWLVEAISTFGGRVEELMPAGFESYLRIFHRPDQGRPDDDSARSWAEVATRHGTTFHPEAQWTALTGGREVSPHHSGEWASSDQPLYGTLDPMTLSRMSELLAMHTTTPELCHFALWAGTGKSPRSWDAHPRFGLPGRHHWLFAPVPVREVPAYAVELEVAGFEEQSRQPGGSPGFFTVGRPTRPEDLERWVRWQRTEGFVQSPSWWWPEDRAWVVHSEVDYDSTLVAGGAELAHALLEDPDIECLRVTPTTSLMARADGINHRP